MFNNLSKIRNKLTLIISFFALSLIILLYSFYYFQAKEELQNRTFTHLSSVKELKLFQITQKLRDISTAFEADHISEYLLYDKKVVFKGQIKNTDTVIKGFPISTQKINDTLVHIVDVTSYSNNEKITLALYQKKSGDFKIAIIQPYIQRVLLERTGLGVSGESYLVGENLKLLSKSRFFSQKKSTNITVNTEGVIKSLNGESGNGIIKDYRQINVFSVYELITFSDIKWVILTEIDEQEAFLPLKRSIQKQLIALLFISLLILLFSYRLSSQLTKPILQVASYLEQMSKGVYKQNIKLELRKDEIGELYNALKMLIDSTERAIGFADKIGKGETDFNFEPLSSKDKLGIALLQMEKSLQNYRKTQKELEKKNQEALISGEEKERKRVSKEIHDGIGPMLTLMQLKIETLNLNENSKTELIQLLNDVLDELRQISSNLMPSVLADFGAGEAIRNLLNSIKSKKLQINYHYDNNSDITIPSDISFLLFRIVQEATNNVIKHANATTLNVSLTEFDDKINLYIKDNGKGFNTNESFPGSGLKNMNERVSMKKGTFEITSSNDGTEIDVEIPL